jgi:hypothetical protein
MNYKIFKTGARVHGIRVMVNPAPCIFYKILPCSLKIICYRKKSYTEAATCTEPLFSVVLRIIIYIFVLKISYCY